MQSPRNTRRRSSSVVAPAAALLFLFSACASLGNSSSGVADFDERDHTQARRASLGFTELLKYDPMQGSTLLEALRRLRPEYLRAQRTSRSPMRRVTPEVYIETMRAGGLDVLHTIPVGHVESVQFIDPVDALIRYGSLRNHVGGVILVRLRKP